MGIMNRGEVNRGTRLTRCRSRWYGRFRWRLLASAGAVNRWSIPRRNPAAVCRPDAVSYRSSAGKHKVLVPADNAGRAKSIAVGRSRITTAAFSCLKLTAQQQTSSSPAAW